MTKSIPKLIMGLWFAIVTVAFTSPSFAAEWDELVKAAKKEGRVSVKGPPGAKVRRALTSGFQKAFPGIRVEYGGGRGGELAAKIIRERRAGIYTTDVWLGGLGTQLSLLRPQGVQDPIRPALIHPEVTDPKKWKDNKLEFADKAGKYALVFVNQGGSIFGFNSALVKSKDVPKSLQDILDPKWKGKIIATDPTASGPGRATFTWLYKAIGPEFIRALGKQKIVFTRDRRSQADQVARGAYLLALGISNVDAKPFIDAGAPLKVGWHLKEGSYASASYGGLALVNRAPHPNAAKVYINWVLGKEGQTLLADAAGWVSRRRDVPAIDPAMELQPGVKYFPIYVEDSIFIYKTKPYRKLMKEAFGVGR
jgi:ABC-type Fe3+ transport system substrate-binding protein